MLENKYIQGFIAGIAVMGFLTSMSNYKKEPKLIYEKTIEGDENKYLIIENKSGEKTPMIKPYESDRYSRLEDYYNTQIEFREEDLKNNLREKEKEAKTLKEKLLED